MAIKKWLHPNNLYQVGRINDPSEHEIHLNELFISKRHMVISVGSVALGAASDTRTPLKVTFQSKAKTVVDGRVFQLARDGSDGAAIVADDLGQDPAQSQLEFRFKSGTLLRMTLTWVGLSVGRASPAHRSVLLDLFNRNIDLRIVADPALATHWLADNDGFDLGTAVALLRGAWLVGTQWAPYVLLHVDRFADWLEPRTELLMPHLQRPQSLLPNGARALLLKGATMLSLWRGRGQAQTLLNQWVECLGGELENVAEAELAEVCQRAKDTRCYLLSDAAEGKAAEWASALQCHVVTWDALYECVVKIDVSGLVAAQPGVPQIEEESPKRRRLGARRPKRVDRLAFFDLDLIPRLQTDEPGEASGPAELQPPVELQSTPASQSPAPSTSAERGSGKDARAASEDSSSHPKRHQPHPVGAEPSPIAPVPQATALTPPVVTRQTIDRPRFVPFVPFKDAVQQAKLKAEEAVRESLGLGLEMTDGISHLAIVETVDMPLRRPRAATTDAANTTQWAGRRNFKHFHKNIAVRPRVSRAFVAMEAVGAEVRAPGASMETELEQQRRRQAAAVALDFGDDDSFAFLSRPATSQSLFVSEDLQGPAAASAAPAAPIVIDSDSDDDQPRFAFRKRY